MLYENERRKFANIRAQFANLEIYSCCLNLKLSKWKLWWKFVTNWFFILRSLFIPNKLLLNYRTREICKKGRREDISGFLLVFLLSPLSQYCKYFRTICRRKICSAENQLTEEIVRGRILLSQNLTSKMFFIILLLLSSYL